jgi:hypothetical protein
MSAATVQRSKHFILKPPCFRLDHFRDAMLGEIDLVD